MNPETRAPWCGTAARDADDLGGLGGLGDPRDSGDPGDPREYDGGTDDFLAGFDALAQAVRRARGSGGADGGLTLSQYGLLEGLANRRAARVQELAASAGISASTATRILDALERRGIVRRTRSRVDRRAVSVSLTERGDALLHAEEDWLRGRQRSFYASLPPTERALAPDLLLRLAALIDELAAGPGAQPVTESKSDSAPDRSARRSPR